MKQTSPPEKILLSTGFVRVSDIELILKDAARKIIIPRFKNLSDGQIKTKSSAFDLVTIADQEAEIFLEEQLLKLLPESVCLGEEKFASDKSLTETVLTKNKPIWTIDPIDGTRFFVNGKEGFGILLGLYDQGKVICGWVYDICADTIFFGGKDIGAFYNNETIAAPKQLSKPPYGWLATHYLKIRGYEGAEDIAAQHNTKLHRTISVQYYKDLIQGKSDFFMCVHANIWDHLPGVAVLEALGFEAYSLDGTAYKDTAFSFEKGLVLLKNNDIKEHVFKNIAQPLRALKKGSRL